MTRVRKTAAQLDREVATILRRHHDTKRPALNLRMEDASEGGRAGYRILAMDGSTKVGAIVVRQHRWLPGAPFGVEHIYSKRLRERIGTMLYEAAAQEACRRGAPFMSDMERSPEADGFWRKQARLGRATRKTADLMGDEVDYYQIGCPAPHLD